MTMIQPTVHRVLSTMLLGLTVQCAGTGETSAQPDSSTLTQERRSDSSPDQAADPSGAAIAQVGAGTTSGSTTGSSGPKQVSSPTPGGISVPPLPSAQLCDAYKDTPVYRSCLSVTLRQ